jgi:tetratricopeptide (TPR) repeat protein
MSANDRSTARPPHRSRGRRLLTQLGIGLAALIVVELALRATGLGPPATLADPYVGFDGSRPLFLPDATGNFLQTAPYKLRHFNDQQFAVQKPANTVRVVCLGGSTTYGRPYSDSTSFAGWLRELLPLADPTRNWEVINAGGVSYASYRVAAVMEELTAYDPDIFVLYTGHNEFLEERTYAELQETPSGLLALLSTLRRTALFHLAERTLGTLPADNGPPEGASLLPGEVRTLLDRSVGLDAYSRDEPLRVRIFDHLRLNLTRMADLAAAAGSELVLVTPASELTDCRPFKSEHSEGLSPERADAIDALLAGLELTGGEELLSHADTVAALSAAVRDDPGHALSWYQWGRSLQATGKSDQALAALRRARDEDIVPLRAPSQVRDIVVAAAAEAELHCLDWETRLGELTQELTGAAIPGSDFFLDHVHMTIDGNRQLAVDLIHSFSTAALLQLSSGWEPGAIAAVETTVLAGLDLHAHVAALSRLAAVLDWAGKRDEARELTRRALADSGGGDAMALWQEGNYRRDDGDAVGAIESYQAALAIDPGYLQAQANLAGTLMAEWRLDEAAEAIERTLALDPDHVESHFLMGIVLEEWGQRRESRNSFRRAIRLAPNHVDALNQLGVSLLRDHEVKEAEQAMRGAILADPGGVRAHFNLGILLSGTGRVDEALIEYETVVITDPEHARAWHRLGLAQAITGLVAEGVTSLERSTQLSPDNALYRQDLEQARTKLRFAVPRGR